jgi:hypothetical protein
MQNDVYHLQALAIEVPTIASRSCLPSVVDTNTFFVLLQLDFEQVGYLYRYRDCSVSGRAYLMNDFCPLVCPQHSWSFFFFLSGNCHSIKFDYIFS